MPNNIINNSPNAVVSKAAGSFVSAGITASNTSIIYLADTVSKVYKSYVPGRGINAITAFEANKGYIIQALLDMDLSVFVVPPVEGLPQLGTPTNILTVNSSSSITNTWASVPNATGYTLQRATDAGFTTNFVTLLNNANFSSYTDSGLAASTAYYYRLKAHAASYIDSAYDTDTATTSPGVAPPAYILDQFTAVDDTLIASRTMDSGQNWTIANGNFKVKTNKAVATLRNLRNIAWHDPATASASAEIDFQLLNGQTGKPVAIIFRYVDVDNYYTAQLANAGNALRIVSVDAGVETAIGFTALGTGTKLRLNLNGNDATLTMGTSSCTASCTSRTSSTKWGILIHRGDNLNDEIDGTWDTINYYLWWPGVSAPPANPIYP